LDFISLRGCRGVRPIAARSTSQARKVCATLLVSLMMLAGCLREDSDPTPPEPDDVDDEFDSPGTRYQLDEPGFERWTLRVPEGGAVQFNRTNGLMDERDDSVTACGSTAAYRVAKGTRLNESMRSWAESRGHAVVADNAIFGPTAHEYVGANENLALTLSFQEAKSIVFEPGDLLVLEMGLRDSGEHYRPFVELVSGSIILETVETRDFSCTAGLSEFSGDFFVSGVEPGFVSIREASFEIDAPGEGILALIGVIDPRFAGMCTAEILIDGESVASAEGQLDACIASKAAEWNESASMKFVDTEAAGFSVFALAYPPLLGEAAET
jgi:hypothetical protein